MSRQFGKFWSRVKIYTVSFGMVNFLINFPTFGKLQKNADPYIPTDERC